MFTNSVQKTSISSWLGNKIASELKCETPDNFRKLIGLQIC